MAGYEVAAPPAFSCRGLPQAANGFWEDARASAARSLAELRKWKERGAPVRHSGGIEAVHPITLLRRALEKAP